MSNPPSIEATELGTPGRVIGKGVRSGQPPVDTDDFDSMRAYANQLHNGKRWHLTIVSEEKMRGLVKLAVLGSDAIALGVNIVELSDAGAPKADIKRALEQLADFIRPLIGRQA